MLVTAFSAAPVHHGIPFDEQAFERVQTPVQQALIGQEQFLLNSPLRACDTPIVPSRCQIATYSASNECWEVGVGITQGYRPSMEDAYTVDLQLDSQTGLIAVFDGHGGDDCALHCVEHLVSAVKSTHGWAQRDLHATLGQAFLSLDSQLCSTCPSGTGTTGTVALLQGPRIVVAGVGDSKAVLLREGRIIPMTVDHRPNEPGEEARIRCAGGFVVRGRVNACLNMSRALGDAQFKQNIYRTAIQQQVSPEPDLREANATSPHDFLLVCSDGVWNSMKETSVLRFVRHRLLSGMPHAQICEQLVQACLEPCRTAYDNITAVLCTVKQPALAAAQPPSMNSGGSSSRRSSANMWVGRSPGAPGSRGRSVQGRRSADEVLQQSRSNLGAHMLTGHESPT